MVVNLRVCVLHNYWLINRYYCANDRWRFHTICVYRESYCVRTGGGITSKGSSLYLKIGNVTKSNLLDLEFFKTLLASFCQTAGSAINRYHYRFYLGHDRDDPFFSDQHSTELFRRTFDAETTRQCVPRSVDTSLKLVACRHSGRPAWAQNDAMLDAYLDGVDYFYRVNDDTKMLTDGWTDVFIRVLNR